MPHKTPFKLTAIATHPPLQALSWLLSVPGASNTIIEASVPYARESLISVLVSSAMPVFFKLRH